MLCINFFQYVHSDPPCETVKAHICGICHIETSNLYKLNKQRDTYLFIKCLLDHSNEDMTLCVKQTIVKEIQDEIQKCLHTTAPCRKQIKAMEKKVKNFPIGSKAVSASFNGNSINEAESNEVLNNFVDVVCENFKSKLNYLCKYYFQNKEIMATCNQQNTPGLHLGFVIVIVLIAIGIAIGIIIGYCFRSKFCCNKLQSKNGDTNHNNIELEDQEMPLNVRNEVVNS